MLHEMHLGLFPGAQTFLLQIVVDTEVVLGIESGVPHLRRYRVHDMRAGVVEVEARQSF